jgi:type II secretory pathway component PulL
MTAEQNPEFTRVKWAVILLMLILAVCILSGCTPSLQKALDKVTETQQSANVAQYTIHQVYPNITAAFSATVYPVQESTDTETTIEQGNVQEFKDKAALAEAKADSLLEALNALPVKPECVDEASSRDKVIYALQQQLKGISKEAQGIKADKERIVTKVTQESTAKLSDCQHKADTLKVQLIAEKLAHVKTREERDTYKGYCRLAAWIGCVLLFFGICWVLLGIRR